MPSSLNRRRFLWTTGAAGLGLTPLLRARAAGVPANSKLRVLSIGVIGTIGREDRKQVASHPAVEIAGLCDVDSESLARAANDHPRAFTCKDYREAFAKHGDEFDAVIVSTPDHTHAPIMLTALANNKHVYGQKPLVHQLEELVMMEKAIAAKPALVTQLGNQRMAFEGRRAAVDILRHGMLGKAVEAHVWIDSPSGRPYYNPYREVAPLAEPPAKLDWNLWLGPCADVPYRAGMAPAVWRAWWNYGSGSLGDWGCHVLDVLMFAYDELRSPLTVLNHCPKIPNPDFHANPCRTTITYAVGSNKFAGKRFPIYYSDSAQASARAALGLPEGKYADENMTVVVCEGGVLTLSAPGRVEIWRDGKATTGFKQPGLPDYPPLNHWHAWVDNCLGKNTELRTPFKDAVRITEAVLLAVKASRFPGRELWWDKSKLAFTNHPQATESIVRRQYRNGFAPPDVT